MVQINLTFCLLSVVDYMFNFKTPIYMNKTPLFYLYSFYASNRNYLYNKITMGGKKTEETVCFFSHIAYWFCCYYYKWLRNTWIKKLNANYHKNIRGHYWGRNKEICKHLCLKVLVCSQVKTEDFQDVNFLLCFIKYPRNTTFHNICKT